MRNLILECGYLLSLLLIPLVCVCVCVCRAGKHSLIFFIDSGNIATSVIPSCGTRYECIVVPNPFFHGDTPI